MFPLCRIAYTMKYRSHAILYRHSGAPLGGPAPFSPPHPHPKQRWGQGSPASPLAQALAGDIQSFLRFALIPHPSKQAGFLRPRYALFIGPPGHASGQPGERSLSIPAPDGRALITPVLRVTVRSRQRRLPKAAFRGSLLNKKKKKNADLSGKESGRNGITTAGSSSSLFC